MVAVPAQAWIGAGRNLVGGRGHVRPVPNITWRKEPTTNPSGTGVSNSRVPGIASFRIHAAQALAELFQIVG